MLFQFFFELDLSDPTKERPMPKEFYLRFTAPGWEDAREYVRRFTEKVPGHYKFIRLTEIDQPN